MKKIIRGKVYDTDTAVQIGRKDYDYSSDLTYCYDELFRKKTGEYFLRCEGGAASKYARRTPDNHMGPDEFIKPISYAAAQEWAEVNLDTDAYIAEFGDPPEDAEDHAVLLKVPAAIYAELKRTASTTGTSVCAICLDRISKNKGADG